MWSLGCCLFELMTIDGDRGDIDFTQESIALFQGDSCYPLSPRKGNRENEPAKGSNDQMQTIIDQIGAVKDYDLSFI